MKGFVFSVLLLGLPWTLAISELSFAASSVRVETVPVNLPPAQKLPPSFPIPEKSSPSTPQPSSKPSSSFVTFNSQPLDKQLQLYSHYLTEVGPPDVLIVGSSRAHQGVDPVVLQRILSSRSRSNVNVFNFGVNGATAQVVDLILRRLLAQKSLPRLILWADGARAFNSGRIDQTYDKIIASPGYKQLLAGIRPIAPQAAEPSSFCVNTSFLYPVVNPAPSQSPSFYSFIAPPTDVKQLCIQPFNRSSQPTSVIKIEPQPSQAINDPAALGFNALATRFNPTSYFRWYPRVSGAFDADYRDFTLQGRQTAALRNVVSFARSHQIPVVFVNLPLTQIYLDEARTEYEQQFRAYMQQFANSGKLTFYDFSQRWLDKYGYFADPSHLNRYGAAAVSAQLGKDLKLLKPVSP